MEGVGSPRNVHWRLWLTVELAFSSSIDLGSRVTNGFFGTGGKDERKLIRVMNENIFIEVIFLIELIDT